MKLAIGAAITLSLAVAIGYEIRELRPYLLPGTTERVIHRSYHEYTVPPNTASITVEIYSMGAGGPDRQACTVISGEKGVNGGGDGGNGVFCGDSVAILPGHGGDGHPAPAGWDGKDCHTVKGQKGTNGGGDGGDATVCGEGSVAIGGEGGGRAP